MNTIIFPYRFKKKRRLKSCLWENIQLLDKKKAQCKTYKMKDKSFIILKHSDNALMLKPGALWLGASDSVYLVSSSNGSRHVQLGL